MIEQFAHAFQDRGAGWLREKYTAEAPGSYSSIFTDVVRFLAEDSGVDRWDRPDPERITVIDHGDYQGTMLFVVAATGYQPSHFWTCRVFYGSCSGCDSFEAARNYRYEGPPTREEVEAYVSMALHMVQGMKEA